MLLEHAVWANVFRRYHSRPESIDQKDVIGTYLFYFAVLLFTIIFSVQRYSNPNYEVVFTECRFGGCEDAAVKYWNEDGNQIGVKWVPLRPFTEIFLFAGTVGGAANLVRMAVASCIWLLRGTLTCTRDPDDDPILDLRKKVHRYRVGPERGRERDDLELEEV